MFRKTLSKIAHFVVALVFLPVLFLAALSVRSATLRRRREKMKPRLILGPQGLIFLKYMRACLVQRGYDAKTMSYGIASISTRADFDYYIGDFFKGRLMRQDSSKDSALLWFLGRYLIFLRLLPKFDILHCFFDGGLLMGTPLMFMEVQLLHLAGKKVIVMPYGGDVMELTRVHSLVFRHGIMAQYPGVFLRLQRTIRRQINYFSQHADFVIGVGHCIDSMPRWDLLATHYYPIDTEVWAPGDYRSDADGRNGEVTIFHSPNHRWLKGTEFLERACRELEQEGYKIRLIIAEGVPNTEVHRLLLQADILAEQFGMPWYGLNAMEGMSLAKPVMSDLSDTYYTEPFLRYTGLDECPIVNTPFDQIKEKLRMLVENPQLRREIGEAGRKYVLKYHSYESVGKMWDSIYRKVWYGEDIDLAVWHPDRVT